jgi:hypothetical protein
VHAFRRVLSRAIGQPAVLAGQQLNLFYEHLVMERCILEVLVELFVS